MGFLWRHALGVFGRVVSRRAGLASGEQGTVCSASSIGSRPICAKRSSFRAVCSRSARTWCWPTMPLPPSSSCVFHGVMCPGCTAYALARWRSVCCSVTASRETRNVRSTVRRWRALSIVSSTCRLLILPAPFNACGSFSGANDTLHSCRIYVQEADNDRSTISDNRVARRAKWRASLLWYACANEEPYGVCTRWRYHRNAS